MVMGLICCEHRGPLRRGERKVVVLLLFGAGSPDVRVFVEVWSEGG